jgi:hypothetical protein
MLVVILGGYPITTYRRFLCQREVTLVHLEGVSPNTPAGALVAEVALRPSLLLARWPVCIEATALLLIGA